MLCYVTRPDAVVMEVEVEAKANGEDCLNQVKSRAFLRHPLPFTPERPFGTRGGAPPARGLPSSPAPSRCHALPRSRALWLTRWRGARWDPQPPPRRSMQRLRVKPEGRRRACLPPTPHPGGDTGLRLFFSSPTRCLGAAPLICRLAGLLIISRHHPPPTHTHRENPLLAPF